MQLTLVEKLQLGDEESVEFIVRELYPKIYAYIYRRIYQTEKARDLTQETFCKFFNNIHQYEEHGKLLNYLYRIAQHIVYDDAKKCYTEEIKEEERIKDVTYDAHQVIMQKESSYILHCWIDELPIHLQEVIRLRYEEDLKFKDISEILGVNVSTIKSRLKLAIEILRTKEKEERLR